MYVLSPLSTVREERVGEGWGERSGGELSNRNFRVIGWMPAGCSGLKSSCGVLRTELSRYQFLVLGRLWVQSIHKEW